MYLGMLKPSKYKEGIYMFSENLKAMRKAKGYTQEELAIKLNVVRQTVSKWENCDQFISGFDFSFFGWEEATGNLIM